jgi:hypothetical protein
MDKHNPIVLGTLISRGAKVAEFIVVGFDGQFKALEKSFARRYRLRIKTN